MEPAGWVAAAILDVPALMLDDPAAMLDEPAATLDDPSALLLSCLINATNSPTCCTALVSSVSPSCRARSEAVSVLSSSPLLGLLLLLLASPSILLVVSETLVEVNQ